jgi:hypothetical protein
MKADKERRWWSCGSKGFGLERFSCRFGDASKTQIPFGNDKTKKGHLRKI